MTENEVAVATETVATVDEVEVVIELMSCEVEVVIDRKTPEVVNLAIAVVVEVVKRDRWTVRKGRRKEAPKTSGVIAVEV